MYNEFIFLFELLFLSIFINYFKNKNITYLYIFSPILIILINLLINKEIILFGIYTTCVEPLVVGLFWISSIIYIKDKENGAKNLINYNLIFSLLTIIIICITLIYNESYDDIINYDIYKKLIFSLILSNITFLISYFFERLIYKIFESQFISVFISQFIDTLIYTFLYFDKPLKIKLSIMLFSFIIKFICILFYYLYYLKNKKDL